MAELEVGDCAPDFELPVGPKETVSLSGVLTEHDYAALIFVPGVGREECASELSVINAVLDEFHRLGAGVIGIVAAAPWRVGEWARLLGLDFPLAADYEPPGAVAAQFGVLHEEGVCARAQFIIDRELTVRFVYVGIIDRSTGAHLLLKALEELNAGE